MQSGQKAFRYVRKYVTTHASNKFYSPEEKNHNKLTQKKTQAIHCLDWLGY